MGLIRLYDSFNRIRLKRVSVKVHQVFYYPHAINREGKREIFVHKGSSDGVMLSRHLQTGFWYYTIHEFVDVLIIGEADPMLEPTIIGALMKEVSSNVVG